MNKETKIIIKGISGTILLITLALFTIYNGYKIKDFTNNIKEIQTAFKEDENITNYDNNNSNENNNTNIIDSTSNYDYENARKVTIYLFKGDGCPHCENATQFFKTIIDDYNIEIQTYEVWKNTNNSALMQDVASNISTDSINSVPFIVFDNGEYFIGYSDTIANKIKEKIVSLSEDNTTDTIKNIIDNYSLETSSEILKKS